MIRLLLFIGAVIVFLGLTPWDSFATFWPWPYFACGLAFLLFFGWGDHPKLWAFLSTRPSSTAFQITVAGLAFLSSAILAVFVLERIPHVTDSTAYLWQARTYAAGKLYLDSHPLGEFFNAHFVINDGKWYSIFPPGWPLVLMIGVWASLEWLVNPILGTITLILAYRWARKLFGESESRLMVWLALASPFFIFMTASFMSHVSTALWTLLALERSHAWVNKPSKGKAFAAGLALGMLTLSRPYNGLLLLLPIAVAVLYTFIKASNKKSLVLQMILAVLPLVAATIMILGNNAVLSEDPFEFPQNTWFERTEENPDCHRLGFGDTVGCAWEHGGFSFPNGFGPKEAWKVTQHRMASLRLNLYGWPPILLLLPIGFLLLGWKRLGWLWIAPIGLVGGYFFFYYHGNCYGPRFYYEALFPWLILFSATLTQAHRSLTGLSKNPWGKRLLSAIVPALVVGAAGFSLTVVFPSLAKNYHNFRGINAAMRTLVVDNRAHNSVIAVPGTDIDYPLGFNFQEPTFDSDVLYTRQWTDAVAQLMYWYPDRRFYRYNLSADWIHELEVLKWDGIIFLEGEQKWPPKESHGGYLYQDYTWNNKKRTDYGFHDSMQLHFMADGPGSGFSFDQWIFEEADYRIEIAAGVEDRGTKWQLSIDGKPFGPVHDGFADDKQVKSFYIDTPYHFTKGQHTFSFEIVDRNPKSLGWTMGIDYMVFRRSDKDPRAPWPRVVDKKLPVKRTIPQ